jgi:hypothetical protein
MTLAALFSCQSSMLDILEARFCAVNGLAATHFFDVPLGWRLQLLRGLAFVGWPEGWAGGLGRAVWE